MSRSRAIGHEIQRSSIRENAVAAFARQGYASASMADLANACGISKATLYHYFESKEALLFECLDAYTLRLQAITEPVTDSNHPRPAAQAEDAKEQLKELLRELLKEYADSRNQHVSLLHDVRFLQAAQQTQIRAQERRVVGHIAELIDAAFPGRVARQDRIPTTMALLGMINFTFAWLSPDGPMSYEEFAEIAIDLWFHGLGSRVDN